MANTKTKFYKDINQNLYNLKLMKYRTKVTNYHLNSKYLLYLLKSALYRPNNDNSDIKFGKHFLEITGYNGTDFTVTKNLDDLRLTHTAYYLKGIIPMRLNSVSKLTPLGEKYLEYLTNIKLNHKEIGILVNLISLKDTPSIYSFYNTAINKHNKQLGRKSIHDIIITFKKLAHYLNIDLTLHQSRVLKKDLKKYFKRQMLLNSQDFHEMLSLRYNSNTLFGWHFESNLKLAKLTSPKVVAIYKNNPLKFLPENLKDKYQSISSIINVIKKRDNANSFLTFLTKNNIHINDILLMKVNQLFTKK